MPANQVLRKIIPKLCPFAGIDEGRTNNVTYRHFYHISVIFGSLLYYFDLCLTGGIQVLQTDFIYKKREIKAEKRRRS